MGAAEDEVMGGDDLLGLRNAPPPGLSPRRFLPQRLFLLDLVVKEMFNGPHFDIVTFSDEIWFHGIKILFFISIAYFSCQK